MYIGFHVKYRYFRQILMELEFSRQTFEKYSNIKFRENLSSGSRDGPYGRTDRHDEAQSDFSKFCELAQKQILKCVRAFFCPVVSDDVNFPHRTSSVNRFLICYEYKYLFDVRRSVHRNIFI